MRVPLWVESNPIIVFTLRSEWSAIISISCSEITNKGLMAIIVQPCWILGLHDFSLSYNQIISTLSTQIKINCLLTSSLQHSHTGQWRLRTISILFSHRTQVSDCQLKRCEKWIPVVSEHAHRFSVSHHAKVYMTLSKLRNVNEMRRKTRI